MPYPGDTTLDQKVQQRILTAFGEAVRLHREGHPEESHTILRSILEVDPRFGPAQQLESAIESGSEVDIAVLLRNVTESEPVDVDRILARARQAMATRDFEGAATLAQSVLRDLPGHAEARQIALEAQTKLRSSAGVEDHLTNAREALLKGSLGEARGFLELARNLDPTHPEVRELASRIGAGDRPPEADPEFEFEVFDHAAPPAPVEPPGAVAASAPAPAVPPLPAMPGEPAPPPPTEPPIPPAPPRSESGPVPAVRAPAAGGFSFDQPAETPAIEFRPHVETGAVSGAPDELFVDDSETRVKSLLDQGQEAFDRGDYQTAVDTWTRIFLIDARNADAETRIEQARRRREEVERLAEHRFYEAREAFDQGRTDEARALCQEVLKLQPQHLEAHDLLTHLETPAAPPPPPPAPAKEDDLFKDDFVPARVSSDAHPAISEIPLFTARDEAAAVERVRDREIAPKRSALPLPIIGVVVGVVAILAVAGFLLKGKVFSGGGNAIVETLTEAEKLATGGRYQEAVTLLQALRGQVEGQQANLVNQRILDYQQKLRARKAPSAASDVTAIREAMGKGMRVKALRLAREALRKIPGEPELSKLQGELSSYAGVLPALADAVASSNLESVRQLTAQVRQEHPDDEEIKRLWAAATFDLALGLLRKYQVAQAHILLEELAKQSPDTEIERLKEFAGTYLSRPIDPRYNIYVTTVDVRPLE